MKIEHHSIKASKKDEDQENTHMAHQQLGSGEIPGKKYL
jgi:hypothetical protein